jgi:hypothetical protein
VRAVLVRVLPNFIWVLKKKSKGRLVFYFHDVVWFSDWDRTSLISWGHHAWYFGFGGLGRGQFWLGFCLILFRVC